MVLHWPALSANNVITKQIRTRKTILIVSSLINIANFAKNTLCIKKQNNILLLKRLCYY